MVQSFVFRYHLPKKFHLTIPNAQKRFFIRGGRIWLPYRSSDFGGFRIRPREAPFNSALRTLCELGPQLGSESDMTRLAANFPVPGPLHHFICFHASYSFDIPERKGISSKFNLWKNVHFNERFFYIYCNIKIGLSSYFLKMFDLTYIYESYCQKLKSNNRSL